MSLINKQTNKRKKEKTHLQRQEGSLIKFNILNKK